MLSDCHVWAHLNISMITLYEETMAIVSNTITNGVYSRIEGISGQNRRLDGIRKRSA